MSTISASVGGRATYEPSDVFPDLAPLFDRVPEQSEDEMMAALSMFPGARRTHHA